MYHNFYLIRKLIKFGVKRLINIGNLIGDYKNVTKFCLEAKILLTSIIIGYIK